MARFVAAIDQGTTSSRCALVDAQGNIQLAQRPHQQIFPAPGHVEHDIEEIWQRVCDVIGENLQQAAATPADLAAIGLTNQRETTVVWDRRTGHPLHNAIVWQDTRTQPICDRIAAEVGPHGLREKTGLPIAPYFAASKIAWLLENVPAVRDAAHSGTALAGTVDSYLVWRLTGGTDGGRHVTDVTNASRTLLMDLDSGQWDSSLLELFGIPRRMLPTIVTSNHSTHYGVTRADGPFKAEIPITGVLGDQQAALVGQACFDAGACKNTYGTGCFMLMNTGRQRVRSEHGLLTTVAYQWEGEPAHYALEGSVAVAGALVQWLRDNLEIIADSDEIEALARRVPDNGDVYFVPAFSGLFAPWWRGDARGVIVGLTGHATKAHLARAALESTAFQSMEVLGAMRQDAGVELDTLRVDGGMTANDLLMQFQADLLDLPVVASHSAQTTALGAAFAAGLAVGFWKNPRAIEALWRARRQWTPSISPSQRQSLTDRWRQAVQRSLDWCR